MADKFTRGPWRDEGYRSVETADGREWICNLADDGDHATMRANARLIAAAPDLLSACRAALGRLEQIESDGKAVAPETIRVLRAAIARAVR